MRWLVDLVGRLRPPPFDPSSLRDEMVQEDPEFARVRRVHHDALNALAAQAASDGLAIRREQQFWTRYGGKQP